MSKINPEWFVDEVAEDVGMDDDISLYLESVERKVDLKALIELTRLDEIPVDDTTGFYSSLILIEYSVLLYKKALFQGYKGSSNGNGEDVYQSHLEDVKEDLRDLFPMITRESILGMETESGEPKGKMAVVNVMPLYNGIGG